MKKAAIILAAHGSRHDPDVNAGIVRLAEFIKQCGCLNLLEVSGPIEVACAFHQGSPTFAQVLDCLTAGRVVVVPVMASEGYYSQVVLPRELKKSGRFSQLDLTITKPVGLHPRVREIVGDRIRQMWIRHGLDDAATSIAIVGHGTRRHANSSKSTYALADSLRGMLQTDVFAAFLDESPEVEVIVCKARHENIFVMPFLIGTGAHALEDIPRRIGLPVGVMAGAVDGKFIAVDDPFGKDTAIPELIIDLAREALIGGFYSITSGLPNTISKSFSALSSR